MSRLPVALLVMIGAATAQAAVTAAPGFAVHSIATPGTVQGGVVRRGEAILVGQGTTFVAGAQSIVRLDGGTATTVATAFNALGGFELGADGTLYAVDNGLEAPGAVTGDTLYAVPSALVRTTALAAADAEVLPAGTIPFAQEVRLAPDGALLVCDAAGPGAGRVVRVTGGSTVDLITGLDFLGGLAIAADQTLRLANLDASFTGNVLKFGSDGSPLGALATGLSGAFDVVLDGDGNALVSGGFLPDFSSSTVVAIAQSGTVTERARGFSFSTEMFFDAARDELLVLDFGATAIAAICRERDGDGVCDADDVCPEVSDPGQTDGDGDGVGDACDPCTGVAIGGATLVLTKLANDLADDTLHFAGVMPVADVESLDPTATGVRFLVNDGDVLDAVVPPGAFDPVSRSGWKHRGRTWTYRSPLAGIRQVKVQALKRRPGQVRVVVRGRDTSYPAGAADLPLKATVFLGPGMDVCGDAAFGEAACRLNPKKGKLGCE